MAIKKIKLSQIDLDPENSNRHSQRSIDAIAASLSKFGNQKPIVVKKVNDRFLCVAGNGRVEAARSLGWTSIDAIETNLEGLALRAFKIADNQTARASMWDDKQLASEIRALPADLREYLGFSAQQLEHIVAVHAKDPITPHDKVREIRIDGVTQEQKEELVQQINQRLDLAGYKYAAIAY